MNQIPLIFLGVFAAFATSFWGLIVMPHIQIGRMELTKIEETGLYYPSTRSGLALVGADVYRANGCVECHSQQVQPKGQGVDLERGWGRRRTIAEDYLLDQPVQLGTLRLGPDLSNVGRRQTDDTILLQHLYNPRLITPGSSMPRHTYLFEVKKAGESQLATTKALPANTEPGFEVTPKPEAIALVSYLRSLSSDATLFSAPFPLEKTNAPVNASKGSAK